MLDVILSNLLCVVAADAFTQSLQRDGFATRADKVVLQSDRLVQWKGLLAHRTNDAARCNGRLWRHRRIDFPVRLPVGHPLPPDQRRIVDVATLNETVEVSLS